MGAPSAAGAARGPQPLWALVPVAARARYLRRTAQALLDELDPLADMLAAETGRPRTEILLAELLPSVRGLHGLADDGPTALQERRLGRAALLQAGRRTTLVQAPVGVVGIRGGPGSPWAEPALEAAAALLAGNGVVLALPARQAGERLKAVFERGGLPTRLVQAVAPGEDLEAVCDAVAGAEAEAPKATMLVLGGAPLDLTVSGALWAAFAHAGLGPAAVGRMVVVPAVADALLERLELATRRLRVGDPRHPETEVGPLASETDAARVEELVAEAVAEGATLVCGGRTSVPGHPGPFYAPALLRGVPPDARLLHEHVPGPVLAVVEAGSETEAIGLAAESGPAAVSVWTGERPRGERIARTLPAGIAWVNEHGVSAPAAPVRVARFVRARQLASQPTRLRSARWLPYDPALVRASTATARLLYGRESERLAALRGGAFPLARTALRLAREARRR